MAIAYFPSLAEGETIEVTFFKLQGGETTLRLLVDTGFIGESSFVLSKDIGDIALMPAPSLPAFGALQGMQTRAIVFCRISALNFHAGAIAILADLSSVSVPSAVHGMVGLQFLRRFRRWGSEKLDDGSWRFFLEA